MKISYNWLKDYIQSEIEINELVEILTNTGLEVSGVEKVEQYKGGLQGLVVGEVKSIKKHPNADRLSLTKVDVGNGVEKSIVCGAPNVAEKQKVVVALPGTTLYPIDGKSFKIKSGKIRGEVSEGMICAEDEIGVGTSHDGIIVLKKSVPVGTAYKDFMKVKEDYALEIDLTPNRTDAISHFGVARDYLAVKNLQPGFKKEKISIPSVIAFEVDNHDLEIDIDVLDKEACPRYSGISMTDIKVEQSPDWIMNKLKAIGVHPINNIVDAANYIMFETGQPLHVFDADEIAGNKVIVRKEAKGSKFVSLDGEERELDNTDLMICNSLNTMCIAGVFGGMTSGVKEETKQIFIESAYFSPSGIRKTARRHGLNTDASYRYERGANPDATIYALKRMALLIKDLTGAKISSEIADVYPFKIEQTEVSLRWSYLKTIAGKEILKDDVRSILSSLDIDIMMEEKEFIKLRIPGYRTEVTREIDIVEEILRIYGYNNIDLPEKMQTSFSHRAVVDSDRLQNSIANFLSAKGFREIINNSLTSAKYYDGNKNLVEVTNPLSNELSVMRTSLMEGGLETISYNVNRKSENLNLYEFGKVYRSFEKDNFEEETKLGIWFIGLKWPESWLLQNRHINFYDVKEIFLNILMKFGIPEEDLVWSESDLHDLEYGLQVKLKNDVLGWTGKISHEKCNRFDLEGEIFMAELCWDTLLKARLKHNTNFSTIPKFPSMRRDLALLIDHSANYEEIYKIARHVERKILKDVNLFDVYQGKGIDKDKKSYGISFIFQDENKTLTDRHVDKIMDKMVDKLKNELGAELR